MVWNHSKTNEQNALFILYSCITLVALAVVLSTVYYTTKRVTDTKSLSSQILAADNTYPSLITLSYSDKSERFSFNYPNYYDLLQVSETQLKLKNTSHPEQNMSVVKLNSGAYLKQQKFEEVEKKINLFCQHSYNDTNVSCLLDFDSIELVTNKKDVKGYTGKYLFIDSSGKATSHKFISFPIKNAEFDIVLILSDSVNNDDYMLVVDTFKVK